LSSQSLQKTKAAISVGFYGNMPDKDFLSEIAAQYDVALVEDAAEAQQRNRDVYAIAPYGINLPSGMTMTKETYSICL